MAYTIYVTYQLETRPYGSGGTNVNSYGYANYVHCNYIDKIETSSIANSTISFLFDSDGFNFLADTGSTLNVSSGLGWTAYKIYGLIQIVNSTGDTATPNPALWKKIDVTSQTEGWISGQTLQRTGLTSTLYTVTTVDYNYAPYYNLDYLNYPAITQTGDTYMGFGDEVFFFGNVKTDIKATAYTTDIPIVLPLNQFNSTTNPTWDQASSVYVSEIGIYDANDHLVAIAKLNNPIKKNSNIATTILFALDF